MGSGWSVLVFPVWRWSGMTLRMCERVNERAGERERDEDGIKER